MKYFFSTIMMVFLCLFGLTINNAFAQTDNITVENQTMFVAKQGEKEVQKTISDNEKVDIITTLITKDTINSTEENEAGFYQFENHTKTNYFITPSLIPLDKGEMSFRSIMVSNNNLSYGLTKHVSISGGFDALPLIAGEKIIWNVSTKIGFEASRNVYIGGGFNYRANSFYDLSMVYGGVTFGDSNQNMTVGIGADFQIDKTFFNPAYSFSAMSRVTNNVLIVSENFWVDRKNNNRGHQYLGLHGIRILNKENSWDIGCMTTNVSSFFYTGQVFLPYVGCKINLAEYFKKNPFSVRIN